MSAANRPYLSATPVDDRQRELMEQFLDLYTPGDVHLLYSGEEDLDYAMEALESRDYMRGDVDAVQVDVLDTLEVATAAADLVSGHPEALVNLEMGEHPVAIGQFLATSLTGNGTPYHAVPNGDGSFEWETADIDVSMLDLGIPGDDRGLFLLDALYDRPDSSITALLAEEGMIDEEPPGDEAARQERKRTIQRYHSRKKQLKRDGLLEGRGRSWSLTDKGRSTRDLAELLEED